MARYIDAELALELHDGELWAWDVPDLKEFFAEVPTADVVPKSEVVAMMQWVELLKSQVAEAKSEAAKEIIDRIDEWFMYCENYSGYIIKSRLAELKKKYLEVNNDRIN